MESRNKEQLPRPAHKDPGAPTVVLVDDDKRVIELLEVALSGSGYRTFSAADGDDAINLVEKVRPDVVVLDVRLPKKNGYQVCEALRSNPSTHTIPVIMISGLVEPSARVQGLRCGADDFLTKPFSPKELLLRIQRILLRESEARYRANINAETQKELLDRQKLLNHVQRRLAARVERVTAVGEMGRTMAEAGTLEELAGQLIVSAQICLRARAALVALRDEAAGEFRILKCRGVSSRCAQGVSLGIDGRLCGALLAEGGPMSLQELDGVPGMRGEILPLRACGLSIGAAVSGLNGPAALIFVGSGLDGDAFVAEERSDFESLCRFFRTGLTSIQRAEADKAGMVDAVETLVRAMEKSGDCRGGHSCRVASFVESIWEALDLPSCQLQDIRLAALLHDLDGADREPCACVGPDTGDAEHCTCVGLPASLSSLLKHSAERYDGSGSPLGLRAKQIPLESRVLAVADTFDECLCRCASSSPVDEAIRHLRRLSGTSLDPNLVEALIHHIMNGRVKVG